MNNTGEKMKSCDKCDGKLPLDFEVRALAERGYFAHMVLEGDDDSPTGCNMHTHGFWDSYGHPDIQVVIALPKNILGPVLETAKKMAASGKPIIPGKKYSNFLHGFTVEFTWAVECGRDILRMILPDKKGVTDKWNIEHPFSKQWMGTKLEETQGTYTQYKIKSIETMV